MCYIYIVFVLFRLGVPPSLSRNDKISQIRIKPGIVKGKFSAVQCSAG